MTAPLEMARNAASHVDAYAQKAQDDPLEAHLKHLGERQYYVSQLAGCMALVSIAEDLHRIADQLCGNRP